MQQRKGTRLSHRTCLLLGASGAGDIRQELISTGGLLETSGASVCGGAAQKPRLTLQEGNKCRGPKAGVILGHPWGSEELRAVASEGAGVEATSCRALRGIWIRCL